MSRVGKKPIDIPAGVKVEIDGATIQVSGKNTTLRRTVNDLVTLHLEDNQVLVKPVNQTKEARSMWGLYRSLIANMVDGVDRGFTKVLDVIGTGYRVEAQGNVLVLNVGYSHPIEYPMPQGIEVTVDAKANRITLTGADKELLGLVAAKVRGFRKPEPYKGKGIKYADEVIRRKVGKAGAA